MVEAILACMSLALSPDPAPRGEGALVDVPRRDILRLEERGSELGIGSFSPAPGMATGVAAADYDNDGDIDLFLPQGWGVASELYRNDGGSFTPVGAASGFTTPYNARCALWADFNADGLLDLVVLHDQFQAPGTLGPRAIALYRQQPDHTFVDVVVGSGLDGFGVLFLDAHGGGLAAGDVTGDGVLDLMITIWDRGARLYEGNADLTFTDISSRTSLPSDAGVYWQPVMFDHEGDGDLDIFMAHDFAENHLLINDGTGTFVDQAPALGVDTSFNEMGVAIGDADNDGDWDLYVTNLYGVPNIPGATLEHNVFFERTTSGSYDEVSMLMGVEQGGWGWGTVFVDMDNDGTLDLLEVNEDNETGISVAPWRFWRNEGPTAGTPVYVPIEERVGFDSDAQGSALLHADIDRDGDQDLVVTEYPGALRVYENNAAQTHGFNSWIVVRPRMPGGPNTRAIGAVVKVRVGGVWRQRLITAGESLMSQIPAEAHFGLGASPVIDELVVEWPDGTTSTRFGVPARQIVDITPAVPRDAARERVIRSLPAALRRALLRTR